MIQETFTTDRQPKKKIPHQAIIQIPNKENKESQQQERKHTKSLMEAGPSVAEQQLKLAKPGLSSESNKCQCRLLHPAKQSVITKRKIKIFLTIKTNQAGLERWLGVMSTSRGPKF